jgi:putative ABC transport system ATP-binding protein
MIQIRDIDFEYGRGDFGLHVPSLTIDGGESIAMIGPSGTGKTTLLNLMAGIYVPDTGSVTINGEEISTMQDGSRRAFRVCHIGLIFQEFELLGYLSVLDNILLPYRIGDDLKLTDAVRDRAKELATDVGLGDKLKRNVTKLSQGERQRVAVCRALLPEPSVLLCDEPTGNLDPANKEHVLDILFDYIGRTGTTLVVVTHDYEILPRFNQTLDVKSYGRSGHLAEEEA